MAVSIGSGIEKVIDQNSEVPGIMDIIFSPDIYVPLLAFSERCKLIDLGEWANEEKVIQRPIHSEDFSED